VNYLILAGPKKVFLTFQPTSYRPVLSLEVLPRAICSPKAKRKHYYKRDDNLTLMHRQASQIFCEMLGQCCYKQFYNNKAMEYQQVHLFSKCSYNQPFVIHCSHDSVTIYFATLSNEYLRTIASTSKNVNSDSRPLHVTLKRTCKYHMRDPRELMKLVKTVVHLLCHLTSGQAHVGYLFKLKEE
jgi:hypothetical protein